MAANKPLPTHDRFDYSPLRKRADYAWPGGKRLAMYLALNVETFGYGMEVGPVLGGALPMPDHRNWSWREYGNRIGIGISGRALGIWVGDIIRPAEQ